MSDTRYMSERGVNDITGTVHNAKTDGTGLVQRCGIKHDQTLYLTATTDALTCKRCAATNRTTAAKTTTRTARASGTGSTAWGVYSVTGTLLTYRTTKRDATAAADQIGDGATVGRI